MQRHRFRQRLQLSTRPTAVCLRSSPRYLPDRSLAAAFPTRSPPRLLNAAAVGGLEPPSERRLRGTYPHLRHSTAERPALRSWHTCKAVRSGARLIWDRTAHQPNRGEHDSRAPVHRPLPDSHAARPCRRRNAVARSRPHCRQRHRCSLRSIRRLSGVSGCPLPQWLGISSRRILRRSILGKWTTAVLLVQITPALPSYTATRWFAGFSQSAGVKGLPPGRAVFRAPLTPRTAC